MGSMIAIRVQHKLSAYQIHIFIQSQNNTLQNRALVEAHYLYLSKRFLQRKKIFSWHFIQFKYIFDKICRQRSNAEKVIAAAKMLSQEALLRGRNFKIYLSDIQSILAFTLMLIGLGRSKSCLFDPDTARTHKHTHTHIQVTEELFAPTGSIRGESDCSFQSSSAPPESVPVHNQSQTRLKPSNSKHAGPLQEKILYFCSPF